MKHTPGPWIVNFRNGRASSMYGHNVSSQIYSKSGITDGRDSIAEVRGVDNEQSIANSRLIAAAPELLEACKAASSFLTCQGTNEYNDTCGVTYTCPNCQMYKKIITIIKKAEGKE